MALVWKVLLVLAITLPAGAYAVGQAVGPPAVPAPASVNDGRGSGDDGAREDRSPKPRPARPVAAVDSPPTAGESGERELDREAGARDGERDQSENPEPEPGSESDEADEAGEDSESEADESDEDTVSDEDTESDQDTADDAPSDEGGDVGGGDVDPEDANSVESEGETDDGDDSDHDPAGEER